MAVKAIVTADEQTLSGESSSVLRKKAKTVTDFDGEVKETIIDLVDTLHSDSLSVGLAAPQIGEELSVVVVNLDKENAEDLILINPRIVEESGSWDTKYESCMSIPHKKGQVKRRKKIVLEYQDIEGTKHEVSKSSFEARVILHEVDHVNGVLFTDRMEEDADLEDTDLFREHGIED